MTDFQPESSNLGNFREEINPLLNPLLEQNLARWAQVYFSTPPAARDEAVRELLRQLRIEADSSAPASPAAVSSAPIPPASISPAPVSPAPASSPPTVSAASIAGASVCSNCRSENAPDQQFCGFCGAPFGIEKAAEVVKPRPEAPVAADDVAYGETFSFLGLDSNQSDNELQFLREKSFGSEYYEPDGGSHRGRYAIAAVVIILAGVSYVKWPLLRNHLPWVSQATPVVQAPIAEARAPQPAISAPAEAQPPADSEAPPQVIRPPNPVPQEGTISGNANRAEQSGKPVESLTLASHTEGPGLASDGTQELQLARRYLDGRGVPHDSGQAAALLWKAVGKQNARADILLADLYVRGDGVPKNCDQARLLLVAATEKSAAGAAEKLRNLESGGCR